MPADFVLVTDDTCDMPPEFYAQHNIPLLRLSFNIDGVSYTNEHMSEPEFYEQLRQGKMPTTSQVNVDDVIELFTPILQAGKDIFYLCFSSGLSGTASSATVATKMLREQFPLRNIRVVDSLCASMGEGLLLYKVIQLRDQGKSMTELADWAEQNKHCVAHYVTSEDLMHLHRGGRISKASAIMGSMLGIKPMIYMNEEGRLSNYGKVRGRKQALDAMVEHMAKAVGAAKNDIFFISHSECREDAEYVASLVKKRFGIENYMIHYIGPVIGSHTGIGTIALFMMAERK